MSENTYFKRRQEQFWMNISFYLYTVYVTTVSVAETI
jgi:hypothetical protein